MNEDKQYFETDDLSECKVMKKVHICPLTTSLSNNHEDSCSLRLLNNVATDEKVCSMELIKLSQPEFLLFKSIWYYATPFQIELAIHCHSNYWHH